MPLTIVPCSKALGAEVRGLDLREPIDGGTAEALRTAWADHLILLVRGQQLRDADLVRFTSVFGECDRSPPNEAALATPGHLRRSWVGTFPRGGGFPPLGH